MFEKSCGNELERERARAAILWWIGKRAREEILCAHADRSTLFTHDVVLPDRLASKKKDYSEKLTLLSFVRNDVSKVTVTTTKNQVSAS